MQKVIPLLGARLLRGRVEKSDEVKTTDSVMILTTEGLGHPQFFWGNIPVKRDYVPCEVYIVYGHLFQSGSKISGLR